jgi:hypothetical protein
MFWLLLVHVEVATPVFLATVSATPLLHQCSRASSRPAMHAAVRTLGEDEDVDE